MLKVGDKAPTFSLKAQDGRTYSLEKLKGMRVVLYFYPKDGTPGCTIESCNFRDRKGEFKVRGAEVLGISADDLKSHALFSRKYRLNFPLLSDIGGKVSGKYGTWKEKKFLGKKFMGIQRSTFIIDEGGMIAGAFYNVNPLGHARGILNALNVLPKNKRAGPQKMPRARKKKKR
ncbi:MAG: thioredoxin-dependent thiol peroxidase [Candidatus Micrarchaeota archaeon]